MLVGRTAKGEFGDDGAVAVGDAFGEFTVLGGVDVKKTGAEDGDGATFDIEGSEVGFGIDTEGEAGDNGVA